MCISVKYGCAPAVQYGLHNEMRYAGCAMNNAAAEIAAANYPAHSIMQYQRAAQ